MPYVCTTADVWTSRGKSFLGMTVNFVDNATLKRKSYVLAFILLDAKQDYKNLGRVIHAIHKFHGLTNGKLLHTVTDGGSNFCKSFRMYGDTNANTTINMLPVQEDPESEDEEGNNQIETNERIAELVDLYDHADTVDLTNEEIVAHPIDLTKVAPERDLDDDVLDALTDPDENTKLPPQMRCFSHLLNNAGTTDFENKVKASSVSKKWDAVMAKLQRFWYLTKKSSAAKQICKQVCNLTFPIPNKTRWNSKFDAIKCIVDRQENFSIAHARISAEIKPKNFDKITAAELSMLSDYVICMEPVAQALDILQGDKEVSIAFIMPTLFAVESALQEAIPKTAQGMIFKTIIQEVINEKFGSVMEINLENRELILASVTHPAFKTNWLNTDSEKFAQDLYVEEYLRFSQEEAVNRNDSNSKKNDSGQQSNVLGQFLKKRKLNEISPTIEALQFLQNDGDDISILEKFPIVRKMFLKFNATLPSSGVIERFFSQALLVFTARRNRLLEKTMEKILLLKHNKDLLDLEYGEFL